MELVGALDRDVREVGTVGRLVGRSRVRALAERQAGRPAREKRPSRRRKIYRHAEDACVVRRCGRDRERGREHPDHIVEKKRPTLSWGIGVS